MYDGPFPEVGGTVIYHDEHGVAHQALVTCVHGGRENVTKDASGAPWLCCVNLVYVSGDKDRQDQYGRQIVRESSVVYRALQSAHGRYYRFEGDPVNPVVAAQT